MALKLVAAAAEQPISLTEAKSHLRVDDSNSDTIIESLIKAATGHAEKFMGRAIMRQTWDFYLDEFPADNKPITVPMPPLIEVVGLFYGPADDESAFTEFEVDVASEPARLYLPNGGSWPTPSEQANVVRVRFTAGYTGDSSPEVANVPADIKAGILMIMGTLYEHRETVVVGQSVMAMPWAAEHLLRQHRVHTAMA